MCIDFFQQGFNNFATIFEPYTKYCAEQVLCQNYCKDLNRNNALFTAYLAWCESQKECNRSVNMLFNYAPRWNLIQFETAIKLHHHLMLWFHCFAVFHRLRLADILVRPMQRLTKYNLLLCAIRKHIVDDSEAEIMDSMVNKMLLISFLSSSFMACFCHRVCQYAGCKLGRRSSFRKIYIDVLRFFFFHPKPT